MKIVRKIKLCLTEIFSRFRVCKNLSDKFFNFALEYAIGRVQKNLDGFILNGTHQLFVYAVHVNILAGTICTTVKIIRKLF